MSLETEGALEHLLSLYKNCQRPTKTGMVSKLDQKSEVDLGAHELTAKKNC